MKSASLFTDKVVHLTGMLPQREFKQARAAATYEALLAAAARVFARRGFEAAQTPEIAAEAGVSTGAFYRYFADKRAIFVEMIAQHLNAVHGEVMNKLTPERFVGHDAREVIDVALGVLFDRIRRDVDLERVFLSMSFADPEIRALRAKFEYDGVKALAALIETIIPRERAPDALAAARVVSIAAVEVAGDQAGLRPRLDDHADDRETKIALREMLYRYLFAPEPPAAARPAAPKPRASTARRPRRTR
jgi:AcrR family transcriptional regulator